MIEKLLSPMRSTIGTIGRNPLETLAWVTIALPIAIEIEVRRLDARFCAFYPEPAGRLPNHGPLAYDEFWSVILMIVGTAIPVALVSVIVVAIKSVRADSSRRRHFDGRFLLAVFSLASLILAFFQLGLAAD